MSITRTPHEPTVVLVHGAFADGLPGDLVLVGQSYGGMLVANAATGNDRVRPLAFVGAFAPEAGMAATQRPIAAAALAEAPGTPAWRTIPSWFAFGTGDRNIPVAALRFMAERTGSRRTVELQDGSHAVAVTEAAAVSGLIREAAGAAASAAGRSDGRVDSERVGAGS